MSDKKRKNASQEVSRPNKKQQTPTHVKVRHLELTEVKPIIGRSPGVTFPANIKFKAFSKKSKDGSTGILLHSTDHPTIDYTANNGDDSLEQHLKHYIAVFDPSTEQLEVAEAQHVHVRSCVRSFQAARDEAEDQPMPVTNYSSRAALTEAFGTKKSRKAVQSIAENRLLAQGTEEADNPISAAMMSDLSDEDIPNGSQGEASALSNKPIPQPNLNTNEISEVYPLRSLIVPGPESQTLAAMPIGVWVARISSKKDVKTRSRFVASRVGHLTKHLLDSHEASDPNLKQHLQVLRYIQILVEIHNYVQTLPKRRPVPPVSKWPDTTFSEGTPMSIVSRILSKFFIGEKLPTTYAVTLLRTTILALTLHVPPPSLQPGQGSLITDPTEISLDMAVEAAEIRKLYRELGCKVEPATETELSRWGLERMSKKIKKEERSAGDAAKVKFAKLRFPLAFPKVSRGKPQGRR